MGRWVDDWGQRRLGELLLDAPDLVASGPTNDAIYTVSGTVRLPRMIALLEVEIDALHGFAPRRIVVRDRAIRVPYSVYEVTGFSLRQGVWVPTAGRLTTHKFEPSEEESERFHKALLDHHIDQDSDVSDKDVQAAYDLALTQAFGVPEAPSVMAAGPFEISVSECRVNDSMDDEHFRLDYRLDEPVFNAPQNLFMRKGSNEWVVP